MRGATAVYFTKRHRINVSIHAPHAGRDLDSTIGGRAYTRFNPRAPCGARQRSCVYSSAPESFQSTRPMRGATVARNGADCHQGVSIHAPHAGRDASNCTVCAIPACFNPRAPCGARLDDRHVAVIARVFQSTRPMRGATRPSAACSRGLKCFNPRAPCGARPILAILSSCMISFNPRAPCGARLLSVITRCRRARFQSTRPMRGATDS